MTDGEQTLAANMVDTGLVWTTTILVRAPVHLSFLSSFFFHGFFYFSPSVGYWLKITLFPSVGI